MLFELGGLRPVGQQIVDERAYADDLDLVGGRMPQHDLFVSVDTVERQTHLATRLARNASVHVAALRQGTQKALAVCHRP